MWKLQVKKRQHHPKLKAKGGCHVFCSFLALVLREELDCRLGLADHYFEWAYVKQDLKFLQAVAITKNEKSFVARRYYQDCPDKVFQAIRVATQPIIREV